MLEVKEVLRRWLAGEAKKAIARAVGVSRNTVRAYVKAGVKSGLEGQPAVNDEHLTAVMNELRGAQLEAQRQPDRVVLRSSSQTDSRFKPQIFWGGHGARRGAASIGRKGRRGALLRNKAIRFQIGPVAGFESEATGSF